METRRDTDKQEENQIDSQTVSSGMAAAAAASSASAESLVSPVSVAADSSFDFLPDEMIERIELLLPESDAARFARTCYRFYDRSLEDTLFSLFSSTYNTSIRLARKQLSRLLNHVIRGEQAQAEEMIKRDPGLLLETGTVTDYSGRKIEGAALQLALGAEDVKYHDDEECMVEMIHKYLKTLPDGEVIIAEQTKQQFPEGWEFSEEQRAMRDSDVLNAVINTIANSANSADWEKAIHTLKNYLESENKSKSIQTGKHFNHQLLVEALALYNQNFNRFGEFDSAKNNAIWGKVIGAIERYVPAATAQALCTGVGAMVDKKVTLIRTLNLHNDHSDKDISYFPLDSDSTSVLGRDFAVYSYYVRPPVASCASGEAAVLVLENLCRIKTSNLQRLCDSAHSPSHRPGV